MTMRLVKNEKTEEKAASAFTFSVNTKTAQAVLSLTDKKETRYYCTGVQVEDSGTLVSTNGVSVLRVPGTATAIPHERTHTIVKAATLETHVKIAKAKGVDWFTMEADADKGECVDGRFPPIEGAYPQNPVHRFSINAADLIKIVEAMKLASHAGKNLNVMFHTDGDNFNRPLLLKASDGSGVEALIVVAR